MSSPDMKQLFVIATRRETEAYEFYSAAAAKVADPNVKDIFNQLAKDEKGHFELIEKFRSNPAEMKKISAPSSDWKVAETQELPQLSIGMKPKDAVALAMKKEQQAVELYRSLASVATDQNVRKMFDNLANMEQGHKHKLETMFVDIGYPEVF